MEKEKIIICGSKFWRIGKEKKWLNVDLSFERLEKRKWILKFLRKIGKEKKIGCGSKFVTFRNGKK